MRQTWFVHELLVVLGQLLARCAGGDGELNRRRAVADVIEGRKKVLRSRGSRERGGTDRDGTLVRMC